MQKAWQRNELEASVKCYMEMKRKEIGGIKFSKKNIIQSYLRNLKEQKNHLNTECKISILSFLKWEENG